MDYFHRRNRPSTEYSGHEEVSSQLRARLAGVFTEYVLRTTASGFYIRETDVKYAVMQQLLTSNFSDVLTNGDHANVFTLVEIVWDRSRVLYKERQHSFRQELQEAFRLSGSVYKLDSGRVTLIPSATLAKKLAEAEPILAPHQKSFVAFYNAVGDLMGRKRKPDDIVKDLFVGTEGYLKALTGENDYGGAVKALGKSGVLNSIQRSVMEKLYGYRSDADGVGHAGNTESPTEIDALWFLETMLAQLTHIDSKLKRRASNWSAAR